LSNSLKNQKGKGYGRRDFFASVREKICHGKGEGLKDWRFQGPEGRSLKKSIFRSFE